MITAIEFLQMYYIKDGIPPTPNEVAELMNKFVKIHKESALKLYTEEEVKSLLETQRGNCYVALLAETKNDEIASIALNSPEPGGKNGTWVK
jgi:hypothetical protein